MKEFFKDFIAESKRVIWPSRKELLGSNGFNGLIGNVLGMSIMISAIIFVMDIVFSKGMTLLQQAIK